MEADEGGNKPILYEHKSSGVSQLHKMSLDTLSAALTRSPVSLLSERLKVSGLCWLSAKSTACSSLLFRLRVAKSAGSSRVASLYRNGIDQLRMPHERLESAYDAKLLMCATSMSNFNKPVCAASMIKDEVPVVVVPRSLSLAASFKATLSSKESDVSMNVAMTRSGKVTKQIFSFGSKRRRGVERGRGSSSCAYDRALRYVTEPSLRLAMAYDVCLRELLNWREVVGVME